MINSSNYRPLKLKERITMKELTSRYEFELERLAATGDEEMKRRHKAIMQANDVMGAQLASEVKRSISRGK